MLQQMGFREGQGLGRGTAGRTAPLDLTLKPGRTGLGVDEARRRRQAQAELGQAERGASSSHKIAHARLARHLLMLQIVMSQSMCTFC